MALMALYTYFDDDYAYRRRGTKYTSRGLRARFA